VDAARLINCRSFFPVTEATDSRCLLLTAIRMADGIAVALGLHWFPMKDERSSGRVWKVRSGSFRERFTQSRHSKDSL